jgi:hypothetical protein
VKSFVDERGALKMRVTSLAEKSTPFVKPVIRVMSIVVTRAPFL